MLHDFEGDCKLRIYPVVCFYGNELLLPDDCLLPVIIIHIR